MPSRSDQRGGKYAVRATPYCWKNRTQLTSRILHYIKTAIWTGTASLLNGSVKSWTCQRRSVPWCSHFPPNWIVITHVIAAVNETPAVAHQMDDHHRHTRYCVPSTDVESARREGSAASSTNEVTPQRNTKQRCASTTSMETVSTRTSAPLLMEETNCVLMRSIDLIFCVE